MAHRRLPLNVQATGAAFWMGATFAARRPQQAEQLGRVELRLLFHELYHEKRNDWADGGPFARAFLRAAELTSEIEELTRAAKPKSVTDSLHGSHRGVRFRLYRRPNLTRCFLAYYRIAGQPYFRGTGTALVNVAVDWVCRMIDEALGGRGRGVVRLEQLVEDYLRDVEKLALEGKRSPATLRIYRPRLRRFVAFCREHGAESTAQLTPELLSGFRSWLSHEQGLKSISVDQHQMIVKQLLRRVDEDLCAALSKVGPPAEKDSRVFTRGEIAGILSAMRRQRDGRQRAKLLRFCLYTGCRNSQARFLAWDSLDLAAGTVALIPQKGQKKPVTIPLSRRLARMLKSIKPGRSPYIFGEMGEQEPLKWLRKAGQAVGIEGHYKFHHLRDTMISWALNDPDSKLGIQDVARMVGHKSLETTRYYLQTDLEALRKKLDTLR